jgi:hypothetical protein
MAYPSQVSQERLRSRTLDIDNGRVQIPDHRGGGLLRDGTEEQQEAQDEGQ